MDWVWHVSPGLQGQWFNELLSKTTLQMESLLLPFLTPLSFRSLYSSSSPRLGPGRQRSQQRKHEGMEDETQHTSWGDLQLWVESTGSITHPASGTRAKASPDGSQQQLRNPTEQQLQLTPHCSPCHRHHLIYTRARGCDSVTQSQILCWPSPGPCIQNTLQMKCEDNMLYHGHLLPVIVV